VEIDPVITPQAARLLPGSLRLSTLLTIFELMDCTIKLHRIRSQLSRRNQQLVRFTNGFFSTSGNTIPYRSPPGTIGQETITLRTGQQVMAGCFRETDPMRRSSEKTSDGGREMRYDMNEDPHWRHSSTSPADHRIGSELGVTMCVRLSIES
jgi:hypothetical protein